MTELKRDFYFIRDYLPLKWVKIGGGTLESEGSDLFELKSTLSDFLNNLASSYPNQQEVLREVMKTCDSAFDRSEIQNAPLLDADLSNSDRVDVSISTSGIGFLSSREMHEGISIEMRIVLESISTTVNVQMAIVDSKLSGDLENPGYWVRGRFLPNQQNIINMIMAHISQRQSERLREKQHTN